MYIFSQVSFPKYSDNTIHAGGSVQKNKMSLVINKSSSEAEYISKSDQSDLPGYVDKCQEEFIKSDKEIVDEHKAD